MRGQQNVKKLASLCPSIYPSFRMEKLGFHWTRFHKIWHEDFPKIRRENSNCIKI